MGDGDVIINFPEQTSWTGRLDEIEIAQGVQGDWSVGARVQLAPAFRSHGDAAQGPLKEVGDVGIIEKVSEKRINVKYNGRTWWYDRPTLQLSDARAGRHSDRTGGAAIGDFVMVLPSARKKDGCVRPGEVGKFIKDDHDGQPFKVEKLNGSNSSFYYEGDMRKATDAEIAASRQMQASAKGMVVGARVRRGRDWKWGDQDGGVGKVGSVLEEVDSDGWVRVKWDSGSSNKYRWGASGCHDLELVDTGTAVSRTGGAAIGDLVMVLPSARKKDGCVSPGEVGKFIKDDHDSQPFKVEKLDGSNSSYYYEGDMRKATDAEFAAKLKAKAAKAGPLKQKSATLTPGEKAGWSRNVAFEIKNLSETNVTIRALSGISREPGKSAQVTIRAKSGSVAPDDGC